MARVATESNAVLGVSAASAALILTIKVSAPAPSDSQDEIARAILHLAAGEAEGEPIDPAHLPAVLQGLAQAKRREFATDAKIEAAFRRFDR